MGFALRVAGLGEDSLWFDTAHSAVVASNPTAIEVIRAAASDYQSPLYFLLLHVWLGVSRSDFWVALPTVFLGTGTVALAYVTGARWFSPRAGVVAALFCAVTSYQVYYSRYPRSYMLLTFLGLLCAYFFARALEERRARFWIAHGVAVVLALYTHPYAVFLVAVLWGYAGWCLLRGGGTFVEGLETTGGPPPRAFESLRQRLPPLTPLLISATAATIAYLPWLGNSLWQWSHVQAGIDAWIEPVSGESLKTLWDWLFFKTRYEYGEPIDLVLRVGRYVLTGLMVLGLWFGRRRPALWLAAGLVIGPIALVYLTSVLSAPLWDPRYFVMVSPFFALWLGYAVVAQARVPVLHGLATGLILAMSVPPLVSLYENPAFRSPDIRAGSAWIREHHQQGELIMHVNYQSYLPALWYDHQTSGDGPYLVPCVWESLPDAWCSGSPYRQWYVNLDRNEVFPSEQRIWLMALYNHNKTGEEEQVRRRMQELWGGSFTVAAEAWYTGVLVYRLDRIP